MKKYFIFSAIIHLAFLLIINFGSREFGGKSSGKKSNNSKKIDIIDIIVIHKEEKVVQKNADKSEGNFKLISKKEKKENIECDENGWFGGIGISIFPVGRGGEFILEVYTGYPASNAGLLPGDTIYTIPRNTNILGAVGTKVDILVKRGGQYKNITLIRDKICFRKKGS